MGQRLNLEIVTHDENGDVRVLANSYYHWSGYTITATMMVSQIVETLCWLEENSELNLDSNHNQDILLAIRLLELTGAGLDAYECKDENGTIAKSSFDVAKELFPSGEFIESRDRNAGLIDITPEGIAMTRKWEDAMVAVYLDTKVVDFSGCLIMMDIDEYLDCYYGCVNDTYANRSVMVLPRVKVDLSDCNYCEMMTFEQFYIFADIVNDMEKWNYGDAIFYQPVFEDVDGVFMETKKPMILSLITC